MGRGLCCRARRLRAGRIRIHAGQPAYAGRGRSWHHGRAGGAVDRNFRRFRPDYQPVHRAARRPPRPQVAAARADAADDSVGVVGRFRAKLFLVHGGEGTDRRGHWRVLVDVGGNRYAACADPQSAAGPGDRQRWKRTCDGGCAAAGQLPRRHCRLARRFLLPRPGGRNCVGMEAGKFAFDAGHTGEGARKRNGALKAAWAWRRSACSSWASLRCLRTCGHFSSR